MIIRIRKRRRYQLSRSFVCLTGKPRVCVVHCYTRMSLARLQPVRDRRLHTLVAEPDAMIPGFWEPHGTIVRIRLQGPRTLAPCGLPEPETQFGPVSCWMLAQSPPRTTFVLDVQVVAHMCSWNCFFCAGSTHKEGTHQPMRSMHSGLLHAPRRFL